MADTTNPVDGSEYNLLKEDCISFSQAAHKLPKVRGKKHLAPATIARWTRHGCCNRNTGETVYLEYIKVGGTNCTSIDALARFFQRLGRDVPPGMLSTAGCPKPPKTPGISKYNSPEKRAEQATEILRRRGIVK